MAQVSNTFNVTDQSFQPTQEAQIAVPAMWSAEANGVMSKSAYKAGFNHVNLREEPQCVAGACMSELRGNGQVDVSRVINTYKDPKANKNLRSMLRCCS